MGVALASLQESISSRTLTSFVVVQLYEYEQPAQREARGEIGDWRGGGYVREAEGARAQCECRPENESASCCMKPCII